MRRKQRVKEGKKSRFLHAIKAEEGTYIAAVLRSHPEEDCVTVEKRKGNTRDACGVVNGRHCSGNQLQTPPCRRGSRFARELESLLGAATVKVWCRDRD